jgi:hypothetical protein
VIPLHALIYEKKKSWCDLIINLFQLNFCFIITLAQRIIKIHDKKLAFIFQEKCDYPGMVIVHINKQSHSKCRTSAEFIEMP